MAVPEHASEATDTWDEDEIADLTVFVRDTLVVFAPYRAVAIYAAMVKAAPLGSNIGETLHRMIDGMLGMDF